MCIKWDHRSRVFSSANGLKISYKYYWKRRVKRTRVYYNVFFIYSNCNDTIFFPHCGLFNSCVSCPISDIIHRLFCNKFSHVSVVFWLLQAMCSCGSCKDGRGKQPTVPNVQQTPTTSLESAAFQIVSVWCKYLIRRVGKHNFLPSLLQSSFGAVSFGSRKKKKKTPEAFKGEYLNKSYANQRKQLRAVFLSYLRDLEY